MMKYLCSIFVALGLCSSVAYAGEFSWQANTEPDMKQYHVYACKIKGCIATDLGALHIGSVPHVTGVARFTFPAPANVEGAAVVTAEDTSGNLSAPSNMVRFSTIPNLPPAAPSDLTYQ